MNVPELIDYDEIIHQDARNGYITPLKAYLEHKPECINKLYQYNESEWTVLLASCYYQHEAIVQMLITQFKCDVEAQGTITMYNNHNFSEKIIKGATPLYAAVAVNNFDIVKFLVEFGSANVNHLTKGHSTPLQAACYNGNFEMIKFLIQHGANPHQPLLNNDTYLIWAVFREYDDLVTYFIDETKCHLNQQNGNGETALHFAVRGDSLDITKLLISRGALNLRDKTRNITPLMSAAIQGKSDFVAVFDGHCSDLEWIEARELLGSMFAGCNPIIEDRNLAIEYLTLAFEARVTKNIPKLLSTQTLKVFDNRRECETLEDLNRLISFGSREAFYMEALLIQERLLGTSSKDYRNSLHRIVDTLLSRNQYDISFRLFFYELDLRRKHNKRFNKRNLRWFASLLGSILLLNKTHQIIINDLHEMLTIITDELSSVQKSESIDFNLVTLLHLITISAQLLLDKNVEKDHKISVTDGKLLLQHIQSIVNKKFITSATGSSMLHLCCNENTEALENFVSYPCIKTVHLLLFCGVDVDAMDSSRNTALHILVRNSETDDTIAVIDLLSNNAGAHLDFANYEGNSPMEYHDELSLNTRKMVKRLQGKMGVRSLKCHCARRIKYGRLPYETYLSSSLVNFVYKH